MKSPEPERARARAAAEAGESQGRACLLAQPAEAEIPAGAHPGAAR